MIKNANEEHKENLSLSDKIALYITNKVGTFAFFIFTVCLTILPFIIPGLMNIIQFISSAFLQLILLPLIIIGQNLQSKHAELRAESAYDTSIKSESKIGLLSEEIAEQKILLKEILEKLN